MRRAAWIGIGAGLALALLAAAVWSTTGRTRWRAVNREALQPPPVVPLDLPGPPLAERPETEPGLVVLVVIDTLRASRTSLCGHDRPTTPTLARLARLADAWTCAAYTPGTWTLPSHASFFTGVPPAEHGMIGKGVRMPAHLSTLAEQFADRGYQSVLVSANPVLAEATGLTRGFHRARVAPTAVSAFRGDGLHVVLQQELLLADAERPLFLVVNIYDAHDPYPAIPEGHPWLPPRPLMSFQVRNPGPENDAYRFFFDQMSEPERAQWIARLRDGYDHAVSLADHQLDRIVRRLERTPWRRHGMRIVVTSDHGEFLGERTLQRHDGPPFEGVTRVPLLLRDTTREARGEPAPTLPEPFPATAIHRYLLDGRLPDVLDDPVISTSVWTGDDFGGRLVDAAAAWSRDGQKVIRWGEARARFDLAADPEEEAPLPVGEGPLVDAVEAAWAEVVATEAAQGAEALDPEVVHLLEELGYLE